MAKAKQIEKAKASKAKAVVAKAKKPPVAKAKGIKASTDSKKAAKSSPVKATKVKDVVAQKAALVSLRAEKSKVKVAAVAKVSMKPVVEQEVQDLKPTKPAKKTRMTKAQEEGLEKATQLGQKWSSLYRKSQEQAKPYNMRHTYEAKTPIMHKVLGWGYILTNKNDRLEVLFKDGIRYLISNYKA